MSLVTETLNSRLVSSFPSEIEVADAVLACVLRDGSVPERASANLGIYTYI